MSNLQIDVVEVSSLKSNKISPGGVLEWSACKQDYALYGTEIYTLLKNESE